jgi:hypothetical protein
VLGVMKDDLMTMFQEFHVNANVPNGLLSYFIALIPKVTLFMNFALSLY